MSRVVRVARAGLHQWEEPCLSGTRGSGTVFFSGCRLRCAFCQNQEISRRGRGWNLEIPRLAEVFRELEEQGAHNLNLVTPTHFAGPILEALALASPGIPVVWNSSGYESVDLVARVASRVDIFLPDFKYALPGPAARYSAREDYPEVAQAAIRAMRQVTGPALFDEEGLLLRGTVVRHLVLPGNLPNTLAALDFLATLPTGTPVSLMAQYTPVGDLAGFPELKRALTCAEYEKVLESLDEFPDLDGWVQDLQSADARFIPAFDGSGLGDVGPGTSKGSVPGAVGRQGAERLTRAVGPGPA